MNAEYVLYGMPISLFTHKLESALIFYRAPFRSERKAGDIAEQVEMRAGTHQVPALLTPKNFNASISISTHCLRISREVGP